MDMQQIQTHTPPSVHPLLPTTWRDAAIWRGASLERPSKDDSPRWLWKLLTGRRIWSAQWCSCSQDRETLQNSHTVSFTTHYLLPTPLPSAVWSSLPLSPIPLANPNHLSWINFTTTLTMNCTLYTKITKPRKGLARFPRQPHPDFRAMPKAAQPPSPLVCVRTCPREKGQLKGTQCRWPSQLTLRKPDVRWLFLTASPCKIIAESSWY